MHPVAFRICCFTAFLSPIQTVLLPFLQLLVVSYCLGRIAIRPLHTFNPISQSDFPRRRLGSPAFLSRFGRSSPVASESVFPSVPCEYRIAVDSSLSEIAARLESNADIAAIVWVRSDGSLRNSNIGAFFAFSFQIQPILRLFYLPSA